MHRKLMILPNYESLHRARFSFEPKPIEAVYHVLKKMNANDTAGIFQTVAEKNALFFVLVLKSSLIFQSDAKDTRMLSAALFHVLQFLFVSPSIVCTTKDQNFLTFIGRTFPKGTKPFLLSLEII